jgi:hypothetical protein
MRLAYGSNVYGLRVFCLPVVFLSAILCAELQAQNRKSCGTLNILKWQRSGAGLNSVAVVHPRPFEPVQFVDSEIYPIRVHWQNELFEDEAVEVLDAAEDAWTNQVETMGFAEPFPDGNLGGGEDLLDLYLIGFNTGAAALTFADDDGDPDDGRFAAPVHIQLNPTQPSYLENVHHEFHHAVQFATDMRETLMFMESTAVYQEALAFPDSTSWAESVPDFQLYPQAPVFTDGVLWWEQTFFDSFYEYGAVLFVMYIDETFGDGDGVLIREIWDRVHQSEESEENEPDWMDAVRLVTDAGVEDMIADFSTWRAMVGPRARPTDGPSRGADVSSTGLMYTRSLVQESLNGAALRNTDNTEAPHQLGCLTFDVYASVSSMLDLNVQGRSELPDQDRRLSFSWLLFPENDDGGVQRTVSAEDVLDFETDIIVPAGGYFVGSVCDVTPSDAEEIPAPHPIHLSIWNRALPRFADDAGVSDAGSVVDGGSNDDGGEPWSCACGQASNAGGRGVRQSVDDGAAHRALSLAFVLFSMTWVLRGRLRRRE